MVDGQRDVSHQTDEDRVLAIDLANDRALLELADAEDRRLPLVEDDRRGEQRTRDAVVGDGEASARHVRTLELPLAGAPGEVVEPGADLLESQASRVLHDRDDKPLVAERGADTDVDRR